MKTEPGRGMRSETWSRLLVILLIILPLAVLFLLPGSGGFRGGWLFWLLAGFFVWLLFAALGKPAHMDEASPPPGPRMLASAEQPDAVRRVMDVRLATESEGVKLFRGPLRESAAAAYEHLKSAFSATAVPLVREDDEMGAAIMLLPQAAERSRPEPRIRPWVHWLLFGLTVVTTTWAGAAHHGVNLLREPWRFTVGLPYSLGLLAILGVHELGHYFTARHHKMRVTPPYFIPLPFALGTFGAFIQMRSTPENRRALFDVAVAGPLAGLAVAIPALLIGLRSSVVLAGDGVTGGMLGGTSVGSSFLFAILSKLALGPAVEYGHVLKLSPLAFAGWLGLFITALNLLPIGQLDGGHVARAMFGSRTGSSISSISLWSLFLLAVFVWPGLLMWAIIVFFIAGRGAPPLEDVTGLSAGRRRLGYVTFAILALILIPFPHLLWPLARIHCPYL